MYKLLKQVKHTLTIDDKTKQEEIIKSTDLIEKNLRNAEYEIEERAKEFQEKFEERLLLFKDQKEKIVKIIFSNDLRMSN